MGEKLLEVQGLKTWFHTDAGLSKAVNDVSFFVEKGKTLGIVGESGCGKSITSLSIMGLVQTPPGEIAGGKILFEGEDLLEKTEEEMRSIRGKKIAMIFQEPMTSLNPVFTIGQQLIETLMLHENLTKQQAREKGIEMLKLVKIPLAEKRFDEYPHQLSGGMRQRVMIAMALCCSPKLLICDEPTTALDVTIQAQILELMKELKEQTGTSVMMITHDLGIVCQMCDNVAIMYAGEIIEIGSVYDIFDFEKPHHPYTKGLFGSLPSLQGSSNRLKPVDGLMPDPMDLPGGCKFHPRCKHCEEICKSKAPEVFTEGSHSIRCHLYEKLKAGEI